MQICLPRLGDVGDLQGQRYNQMIVKSKLNVLKMQSDDLFIICINNNDG
ncbi:hypothetical protein FACS189451_11550 [Bacteroidia bacterium]|nr:hypothetical protein FACS189451_11550 [Bacteroidia bacterium]